MCRRERLLRAIRSTVLIIIFRHEASALVRIDPCIAATMAGLLNNVRTCGKLYLARAAHCLAEQEFLMITRRHLAAFSLAQLSCIGLGRQSSAGEMQSRADVIAFEQGDPEGPIEEISYDSNLVANLISPLRVQNVIPDPIEDFSSALISVAKRFVGYNREDNESEITQMLQLFGIPFRSGSKYTAYCAAGIGYCAVLALAKASHAKTDVATLQRLLPVLDYYNYYPSPAVLSMSRVARGKSRWVEARTAKSKPVPTAGSLIVYDWSGSEDAEVTSHTGIVLAANGIAIDTLEFNTGDGKHKSGAVALKTRPYGKNVKGFVMTASHNKQPPLTSE